MRIGTIGAGNMADALATQWVRAGHEVVIGARTRANAERAAARIGPGARAGTLQEAAAHGDAVLLAVRHDGVPEALRLAGGADGTLRGRTLVDCTNALEAGRVVPGPRTPVAEQIAAATGAHVVKAFNLCHVDVWRMTPPAFDGRPLCVPLCGDDPGALATVRALVTDLGCAPLEGGGLDRAGLLEATAAFAIGLLFQGDDPRGMFPPIEYAAGPPSR